MNSDTAFLIDKHGKVYKFSYNISHANFLKKLIGITINVSDYIEKK